MEYAGRWVSFEDLLAAICLPAVAVWIAGDRFRTVRGARPLVLLWLLIIALGLIGGVVQSLLILGAPSVPTEIWQYVKRMVFFLTAMHLIAEGYLSSRRALRALLVVMGVMVAIGLLQLRGPLAVALSSLYSRSSGQLEALVEQGFGTTRNYSVTGFSTS
jgi:hypothetical protein